MKVATVRMFILALDWKTVSFRLILSRGREVGVSVCPDIRVLGLISRLTVSEDLRTT